VELLEAKGTSMQDLLSGAAAEASGSLMDEDTWQLLLNLVEVELFHLVRAKGLQSEYRDRMRYSGWF
jgi:hypothetical protein